MTDGHLPVDYFDRLYAADPDPWGFASRWYERRKYALTLAALPREHYRAALEVGCSIGVLTAQLGPRCTRLLAIDAAAAAVHAARRRTAGQPGVTVEQRVVPREWPRDGDFDLILLSEVGYYFERPTLAHLLDLVAGSLVAGGTMLAVHWRPPAADYPLTGEDVHHVLSRDDRFDRVVAHVEELFLLDVFRPR
jgi:protein-L-isoaspartate O-methyltransferase